MAISSTDPMFDAPFTNGDIAFTVDGGTEVVVGGITDVNISTNTETSSGNSGYIFDERRNLISQEPTATFTTSDVGQLLGNLGIAGACLDGTTGWYAQVAKQSCGGVASGSVHGKYQITDGVIHLDSLSADARADATVGAPVHAIYDGENSPLASTFNNAKWDTAALPNQYTLGACAISLSDDSGATEAVQLVLNALSSAHIDFGVQLNKRAGPESVWPTFGAVTKVTPTITLAGIEIGAMDDTNGIKLLGRMARQGPSGTLAITVLQLRRRGMSGGFASSTATEHSRIKASGLAYVTQPYAASGQDYGEINITIECTHDGTNAPLVIGAEETYIAAINLND